MKNRELLFALDQISGVGYKTIKHLIACEITLENLPTLSYEQLLEIGVGSKQATSIVNTYSVKWLEEKTEQYRRLNIGYLTPYDAAYPKQLQEIAQPPWVLYYKGNLQLLEKPLLAMVGTRMPTVYGKKVCDDLAFSLASSGFGIVSGLARGIDTTAHRGTLRAEGSTIAVLGSAINVVYPPENASLYKEIEERGLILSEYPIGTKSLPGLFPMRNRIIAGLSVGVVVVEAAERSGSLITADSALESSRDVFAVPGPITSPNSRGCLRLIQQGAKLVISVDDILEDYRDVISLSKQAEQLKHGGEEREVQLTSEEAIVYRIIIEEPRSLDALLQLTSYKFGLLHSVLLSLLMKKKIVLLPGSTYMAL
ncbi:DNA-processing protein DprA [Paenibacillus sp. N1-5-1-14]|uniref:DNA-processing protein DprA n=1 Tax=Paenibacillus radicibacter TaxID=2972488 RepID=UPI0021591300|nr:DNA-processing protein DprA [Paenibacillus radicibacter]MCR8642204.1 DNA-processing protein DprA [Paenibacillus radicibacter]